MGEMLRYLLVAALFVMVQVVAGRKKKKKSSAKGSVNREFEPKKVEPINQPEKTAEESARVFMEGGGESDFDDPCDSEDEPRIHLHQADEQAMEQAGEGEDPCHAGAAPKRPSLDDEDEPMETDTRRAAFERDVLRGVIMSEVLTRPSERAALRRMKRGRRA